MKRQVKPTPYELEGLSYNISAVHNIVFLKRFENTDISKTVQLQADIPEEVIVDDHMYFEFEAIVIYNYSQENQWQILPPHGFW